MSLQEFREGRTDDKSRYIELWNAHIKQLEILGMPLVDCSTPTSDYYDELKNIQKRLEQLVKLAADSDFQ